MIKLCFEKTLPCFVLSPEICHVILRDVIFAPGGVKKVLPPVVLRVAGILHALNKYFPVITSQAVLWAGRNFRRIWTAGDVFTNIKY